MGYVVGRCFVSNTVGGWGLARVKDGDGRQVLVHENHRVHPYPTPRGVGYATSVSNRQLKRGVYLRMKVVSDSRGLVAQEWMYLDDYERAQRKAREKRRRQERQRQLTKRTVFQATA